MIIVGALFIMAAAGAFVYADYQSGIWCALVGSCLLAYGFYRNKQKQAQAQAQAQKQTVIVNNYITQPTQQPDRTQIVTARVVRTNDDDLPEQ